MHGLAAKLRIPFYYQERKFPEESGIHGFRLQGLISAIFYGDSSSEKEKAFHVHNTFSTIGKD
jgi:hypothetical protein